MCPNHKNISPWGCPSEVSGGAGQKEHDCSPRGNYWSGAPWLPVCLSESESEGVTDRELNDPASAVSAVGDPFIHQGHCLVVHSPRTITSLLTKDGHWTEKPLNMAALGSYKGPCLEGQINNQNNNKSRRRASSGALVHLCNPHTHTPPPPPSPF